MNKYRAEAIAETYLKTGLFKPDVVAYGNQILYEMEQDKIAMVQAIGYLMEYVEYRAETKQTPHTFGDQNCNFALDLLIKRVSKYSCPNNLKEHLRTKENCPLKEQCKCAV